MMRKDVTLDLESVERKLAGSQGRTFWQSLEELSDDPAFQEMLHREFPENATDWGGDVLSRRRFLTLMGASLALAGLSGCSRGPQEKIVPYVVQPEGIVPGKAQYYATALNVGGAVTGVLVESHMGRPTKIEGNQDHPASLGASDVFAQADILTMYDPDREQTVSFLGRVRVWEEAIRAIREAVAGAGEGAERVRILTETVTSPTLRDQFKNLLASKGFAKAKVVVHEPTAVTDETAALKSAFNDDVEAVYNLDQDGLIIVALDADFLTGPGANLRNARHFGQRRNPKPGELADKHHGPGKFKKRMNRLYAIETMISPTGAIADHRLALKPSEIDAFARALAAKVGIAGVKDADNEVGKMYAPWIDEIAKDLTNPDRAAGRAVIIPGPYVSKAVHQLAHAINDKLGSIGKDKPVSFVAPVHKLDLKPENSQTLDELVADMNAGKVDVLLVLGGNPAYTVPATHKFADAVTNVKVLRVRHGLFNDETSELCQWNLPATHAFEQWSDAAAFDGTVSIVQPLIAPLYSGRSVHELISALSENPDLSGYELVRTFWKKWHAANQAKVTESRAKDDFELFWKQSLFKGVIDGTASERKTPGFQAQVLVELPALGKSSENTFEVNFRPDPALFDGRFANNGWLQEWPKPLTKITWDNVAYLGLATARAMELKTTFGRRGGEHGETYVESLELTVDGRKIVVPAWIVPGHAEGSITLTLGYGRKKAGRVAMAEDRQDSKKPIGVDVGPLRKTAFEWAVAGVVVKKLGGKNLIACTQAHHNMEGRDIIRTATFKEVEHPGHGHKDWDYDVHVSGQHGGHHDDHKDDKHEHPEGEKKPEVEPLRHPLSLLPVDEQKPGYHRWGMVINLGSCTGCSACVVACQAENNIPVVGKDQVNKGREMHWIRIDRYYFTDQEKESHEEAAVKKDKLVAPDVGVMHMPTPCQQCEKAPCEQVCPVSATVHSDDGLNDMIYNRCVGTRYCSNNCPYKVRRFNFLDYQAYANDSLKLVRNPEVTVRTRGVMEKCTYCVQRIRQAEISSRKEGRSIEDGEVVTACQSACPTQAIVFGDLGPENKKPQSLVGQLRAAAALNYSLLDEELNTKPRTTYMTAVKNPNEALVKALKEKKG